MNPYYFLDNARSNGKRKKRKNGKKKRRKISQIICEIICNGKGNNSMSDEY
jgi:hypothetical protein